MAVILVSILTTFVVIPVLLFVGIIFFCYAIFAYVMFCKGLKRFLLRDNIPSRWYWFPLYNLYLMGNAIFECQTNHSQYDVAMTKSTLKAERRKRNRKSRKYFDEAARKSKYR